MRAQTRLRYAGFSVAVGLVVASIGVACSLNPQPIPPGEQPDGAGGSANPNFGDGVGDGGTKLSDDAGTMSTDASTDAPVTPPPQDAGPDASDASDDADAHD
ncbi:MAG: hypothetical protein ABIP89_17460 [Polyangiaceae bacterium]